MFTTAGAAHVVGAAQLAIAEAQEHVARLHPEAMGRRLAHHLDDDDAARLEVEHELVRERGRQVGDHRAGEGMAAAQAEAAPAA